VKENGIGCEEAAEIQGEDPGDDGRELGRHRRDPDEEPRGKVVPFC